MGDLMKRTDHAYLAWREWWTERAAIGEYLGGLTRAEAERQADEIAGPPPGRGAR